jgi:hypothetical protein
MRLRVVAGGSLFAAFAAAFAAAVAPAAPRLSHGLTINATPKSIIAGEEVLIYGQLKKPHRGAREVVLHQRINPAGVFTAFRVVVPGGEGNIGGASSPVAISVTLPAVGSLPPAS